VITINGKEQPFTKTTLQELLVERNLAIEICAVEVNSILIPHKDRNKHQLQDGDKVEIVSLVGGG
jgi:thiamine biosynthesis protein ThiS